jgi:hypothetical protein
MMIPILEFFLVLVVVPLYFVLSYAFARKSGWNHLAEKYKCGFALGKLKVEQGNGKAFTGGAIGGVTYQYLRVGMSADGLYLNTGPFTLGCPFHPTLRIPWSAIESVEESADPWGRTLVLKLICTPTTIRLNPKSFEGALPYLGDKLRPSLPA